MYAERQKERDWGLIMSENDNLNIHKLKKEINACL